jgi:hypothetical protein
MSVVSEKNSFQELTKYAEEIAQLSCVPAVPAFLYNRGRIAQQEKKSKMVN